MIIFLLIAIVVILLFGFFGGAAVFSAIGTMGLYILGFIGLTWAIMNYGIIGLVYGVGCFLLVMGVLCIIGLIEGKMALARWRQEHGSIAMSDLTQYKGQGYVLLDQATRQPVDLYGHTTTNDKAFIYEDSTKADAACPSLEAKTGKRFIRSKA